ncbi:MAG: zinc-dependent alcohol dehydrogenase family protein [Rubrivivax sp.]|nr:zinc-dependent alcohol dehydrogenase family protein [Rubrivivax sp.]
MKAVVLHRTGGPEVLQWHADWPTPEPGPGEVRVQAQAIGVGRPDVLVRSGRYKWMPPLPAIPGSELAGTVEALGPGVQGLVPGDPVLVSARELTQRGGGYAEYQCAPAEALFRLPPGLSFVDAVSLPNLQLALALLQAGGGVADARAVLVTGAAGGVASALAQAARARGLQVIGTARTAERRQRALQQGCDAVLDPAAPELARQVQALTAGRGVDLAFDAIGGRTLVDALRALAPLGTLVSYNVVSGPPAEDVFQVLRERLGHSLAVRVFSMHTLDADRPRRRALMEEAIALMASGGVRAPQATVLPLAEAAQAHRVIDAGEAAGKLVLVP